MPLNIILILGKAVLKIIASIMHHSGQNNAIQTKCINYEILVSELLLSKFLMFLLLTPWETTKIYLSRISHLFSAYLDVYLHKNDFV